MLKIEDLNELLCVKIIKDCPNSINEMGDEGLITEIYFEDQLIRVHVYGKENQYNWHTIDQLELVNE